MPCCAVLLCIHSQQGACSKGLGKLVVACCLLSWRLVCLCARWDAGAPVSFNYVTTQTDLRLQHDSRHMGLGSALEAGVQAMQASVHASHLRGQRAGGGILHIPEQVLHACTCSRQLVAARCAISLDQGCLALQRPGGLGPTRGPTGVSKAYKLARSVRLHTRMQPEPNLPAHGWVRKAAGSEALFACL